jgi:hypothetical protein
MNDGLCVCVCVCVCVCERERGRQREREVERERRERERGRERETQEALAVADAASNAVCLMSYVLGLIPNALCVCVSDAGGSSRRKRREQCLVS